MDFSNPIVYELGLTIVALVAFVVWQSVTLKRDMKRTREEAERAARDEAQGGQAGTPPRRD